MMGMSKSTAYASSSSIRTVVSNGIRANAYEIQKSPSKVQPKKELGGANPYTDTKFKK